MSWFARLLFRGARWVAGRERKEWVDAMTAEAQASEDSNGWAIGCLWAAMKDRLSREWQLLAASVLAPVCVVALQALLFLPLFHFSRQMGLPVWTFIPVFLLLPFPFAIVIGRMLPGSRAYLAASVGFMIVHAIPPLVFWAKFGKSPLSWFGRNAHWYNMSPAAGLGTALLVWLAGAWLGSFTRRRASRA